MIGSHDTMTYLPVKQWYFKPLKWTAKCQSKTLSQQFYDHGVRLFDFRVRFDKNGNPIMAHGPIVFKGCISNYMYDLNNMAAGLNELVYVRVLLESNSEMKDQEHQEALFKQFCDDIQAYYKHLTFFGGRRKYDWKIVYKFPQDVTLDDKYSSVTNIFGGSKDSWVAKLDDLWPWLYAKLRNKKNIANHKDEDGILFIDFVNIK